MASLVVAAGIAACADGSTAPHLTALEGSGPSRAAGSGNPTARVARYAMWGGRNQFRVGDSVNFELAMWDARGARITDIPVTYRVSQPAHARIDSVTGALVVLRAGATVLVTATAGPLFGSTQFWAAPAEDGRTELSAPAQAPVQVDTSSKTTTTTPVTAAPSTPTTSTPTVESPALPTGTVARISLWGAPSQARVGDTVRFSVPMWDASGQRINGGTPTFTVSRPDLATIDASGLLKVIRSGGSVLVTGSVAGQSAAAQFYAAPSLDGQTDLTVAYVSPVTRVVLQGLASSYTSGQTAHLGAVAYNALNQPVTGLAVQWSVDQPSVATVDSTGLLAVKLAPDTVTVSVRIGGVTTSGRFESLVPTNASGPVVTTSGGVTRIPATIARFAGSGATLVSSGVPLTPGLLRPSDPNKVRVLVNGTEQAVYTEPLSGLHADGSLRAVLVQFSYALNAGDRVPAVIEVGARPTRTIAASSADRGRPDAGILPTSPSYLVATDIAGATVTAAEAAFQTPLASQYDADFGTYSDRHWALTGSSWGENYYDRAAIYIAQWARTANPTYWYRGISQAQSYRTGYLEANNYGTSPHWAQPEGLERHYLVTGDTASRYALNRVAGTLSIFAINSNNDEWVEGRILARTLMTQLLTWRISPDGTSRAAAASLIDRMLTNIPAMQSADGGFRFRKILGCDGTLNYMDGMLDDALIQTYTYYRADSRIVTTVKKSADYLWTQWNGTNRAFKYFSKVCPTGDETATPELNNLMINAFAWSYVMSREFTYKARADQIFAGSVLGSFLSGTKQFNQQYTTSHHYLGYRMR